VVKGPTLNKWRHINNSRHEDGIHFKKTREYLKGLINALPREQEEEM
jgi:hypothetical protein